MEQMKWWRCWEGMGSLEVWTSHTHTRVCPQRQRKRYVKGSVTLDSFSCVLPPWHRKYRSATWHRKKPRTLMRLETESMFSLHCCFQSKAPWHRRNLHLLIYIKLLPNWVNTKKFSLLSKPRSISDLSCVLLACLIASEVISGQIWTFFNRVDSFVACCFIVSGTFASK